MPLSRMTVNQLVYTFRLEPMGRWIMYINSRETISNDEPTNQLYDSPTLTSRPRILGMMWSDPHSVRWHYLTITTPQMMLLLNDIFIY